MNNDREQLLKARELIVQKQFDAARTILNTLPHNDTARTWLAKLNEIAPPIPDPFASSDPFASADPFASSRPAAPASPFVGPRPATALPAITNQVPVLAYARYGIGAIVIVVSLFMLVGFFVFPWLDLGEIEIFGFKLNDLNELSDELDADFNEGQLKLTPLEIWIGNNNGDPFSLSFDSMEQALGDESSSDSTSDLVPEDTPGGFGDVRPLDRLLILVPIGAIILLWFAWMYLSQAMKSFTALTCMSILALLLLIFPYAWQELTQNDWENAVEDNMTADTGEMDDWGLGEGLSSMYVSIFEQAFSTTEQVWMAGIILAVCLGGVILEAVGKNTQRPSFA